MRTPAYRRAQHGGTVCRTQRTPRDWLFFVSIFIGVFRSDQTQISDLAFQIFDLSVILLDSVLFTLNLLVKIPDYAALFIFNLLDSVLFLLDSVLFIPDLLVIIADSVALFV